MKFKLKNDNVIVMHHLKTPSRLQQGFTLVELIVVIAIIGLLATVGVSSYSNVLKSGRDAKRKADLQEFVTAVKLYQIQNGKGPAEVGYCQSSIGNDPGPCPPASPTYSWDQNQTWTDLVTGGYLEKLPVDPLNNTTHYYYFEPDNPGGPNQFNWLCPASTPSGSCGGYISVWLESTNTLHKVTWQAP